ncbi:uncharacterized protein LOC143888629 [Tasmannia lanceolata]|uniref:uncharacterized protein LOC143888629 n=1 Tax=Tasmannia lanceolata TaxID=3420 RepID=UPI0040641205
MTVAQYGAKFRELSRYAPGYASIEEDKVEKFMDGFRPSILASIVNFDPQTLADACGKAERGERMEKKVQAARIQALGSRNPAPPSKKPRTDGNVQQDVEASNAMIEGQLLVNDISAHILIDSGSTLSFISPAFVEELDLTPIPLLHHLKVVTPIGDIVATDLVCKGCVIKIGDRELLGDLVLLDMNDFKVILGMDWLASYHASVVCFHKLVRFNILGEEEYTFEGVQHHRKIKLIAALQTQKLLNKRYEGYLAYVTEEDGKEELSMTDIPVVSEFLDVFSEDLTELPPHKKVDFTIDLELGTKPISKAPYRMAPTELKELMDQLAELLENRFIRPSLSPWGAPVLFVKKKDGPATKLTRKNAKYVWTEECENSFQELKKRLTSSPILVLPSEEGNFVVYSETSFRGLGFVLMQSGKVITFVSRQLKLHEKELNMRQRRWLEFLKDDDFTLSYHPGKANVVADALSRQGYSKLACLMIEEWKLLEKFRDLDLGTCEVGNSSFIANLRVKSSFVEAIKDAQAEDGEIKKFKAEADTKPNFSIGADGGLYFKSRSVFQGRICVPNKEGHINSILEEAHKSVTPSIRVKVKHRKPSGMLDPLEIPVWKWDSLSMDFIMGLQKTKKGFDAIWVIVDRLTKSTHFFPIKKTWKLEKLADEYVDKIAKYHGVPSKNVSDRDTRFTSGFWKSLHTALGTNLSFSTAYHPQIDGQMERVNQILEDLLRACILISEEIGSNTCIFVSLRTITATNRVFRWLHLKLCIVVLADLFCVGQRQKSYADQRRGELEFAEGDMVFVKISPFKAVMRFGRKGKLSPRFIGPYRITKRIGARAYQLELPPHLEMMHNVFHMSMLHLYDPDPSHVLAEDEIELQEDLSFSEKPVRILERKMKVLKNKKIPFVKILWRHHNEEATWERESEIQKNFSELYEGMIHENNSTFLCLRECKELNFGDEIPFKGVRM